MLFGKLAIPYGNHAILFGDLAIPHGKLAMLFGDHAIPYGKHATLSGILLFSFGEHIRYINQLKLEFYFKPYFYSILIIRRKDKNNL